MNKLTIPTILMATVMIAGIFAFMPVDNASAVHTTIQGTQFTNVDIFSATSAAAGIDCDSDQDFIVKGFVGDATIDGETVTILMNGVTTLSAGEVFANGDTGSEGFGGGGYAFTLAAEEDDTVVVDGSSVSDVIVTIITGSGATALCAAS